MSTVVVGRTNLGSQVRMWVHPSGYVTLFVSYGDQSVALGSGPDFHFAQHQANTTCPGIVWTEKERET